MTEFILHLGAHKTATTFVQKTLQNNSAMLLTAGIAVPNLTEMRQGLTNGLGAAGIRKTGFTDDGKVILSDENVIGYPDSAFKTNEFYPNVASRCQNLAGRLPEKPSKILFTIRSYGDYFTSAYALWLGDNQPLVLRDEICDDILKLARGWPDVIKDIRQGFPDTPIIVTVYEPSAKFIDQQFDLLVGPLAKKLDYNAKYFWNKILPPEKLLQLEQLIQSGGADRHAIAALRKQKLFGKPKPHHAFWDDNQRRFLDVRFANDLVEIQRMDAVEFWQ